MMSIVKDLIIIMSNLLVILYFTSDCYISLLCTAILTVTLFFRDYINRNNYLKKINNDKEFFIETLIHDLKIPTLAQLRGIELIRNENFGEITKEQKDMLIQIETSCKYILDMISMVLKTYRFENGTKRLIPEKINIYQLFKECSQELENEIQEKNLHIILHNIENIEIEADREDMKTVILNLLSNAILYSNQNEIIEVNSIQNISSTKFEIIMNGNTLSEHECSIMFNKTSSNVPRYTTIGYGIGLYLCKKIIECHKGNISAYKEGCNKNKFVFSVANTLKLNKIAF